MSWFLKGVEKLSDATSTAFQEAQTFGTNLVDKITEVDDGSSDQNLINSKKTKKEEDPPKNQQSTFKSQSWDDLAQEVSMPRKQNYQQPQWSSSSSNIQNSNNVNNTPAATSKHSPSTTTPKDLSFEGNNDKPKIAAMPVAKKTFTASKTAKTTSTRGFSITASSSSTSSTAPDPLTTTTTTTNNNNNNAITASKPSPNDETDKREQEAIIITQSNATLSIIRKPEQKQTQVVEPAAIVDDEDEDWGVPSNWHTDDKKTSSGNDTNNNNNNNDNVLKMEKKKENINTGQVQQVQQTTHANHSSEGKEEKQVEEEDDDEESSWGVPSFWKATSSKHGNQSSSKPVTSKRHDEENDSKSDLPPTNKETLASSSTSSPSPPRFRKGFFDANNFFSSALELGAGAILSTLDAANEALEKANLTEYEKIREYVMIVHSKSSINNTNGNDYTNFSNCSFDKQYLDFIETFVGSTKTTSRVIEGNWRSSIDDEIFLRNRHSNIIISEKNVEHFSPSTSSSTTSSSSAYRRIEMLTSDFSADLRRNITAKKKRITRQQSNDSSTDFHTNKNDDKNSLTKFMHLFTIFENDASDSLFRFCLEDWSEAILEEIQVFCDVVLGSTSNEPRRKQEEEDIIHTNLGAIAFLKQQRREEPSSRNSNDEQQSVEGVLNCVVDFFNLSVRLLIDEACRDVCYDSIISLQEELSEIVDDTHDEYIKTKEEDNEDVDDDDAADFTHQKKTEFKRMSFLELDEFIFERALQHRRKCLSIAGACCVAVEQRVSSKMDLLRKSLEEKKLRLQKKTSHPSTTTTTTVASTKVASIIVSTNAESDRKPDEDGKPKIIQKKGFGIKKPTATVLPAVSSTVDVVDESHHDDAKIETTTKVNRNSDGVTAQKRTDEEVETKQNDRQREIDTIAKTVPAQTSDEAPPTPADVVKIETPTTTAPPPASSSNTTTSGGFKLKKGKGFALISSSKKS